MVENCVIEQSVRKNPAGILETRTSGSIKLCALKDGRWSFLDWLDFFLGGLNEACFRVVL
jgi:hypothetical protein